MIIRQLKPAAYRALSNNDVGYFPIVRGLRTFSFRHENHVGGATKGRRKKDAADSGHGLQ